MLCCLTMTNKGPAGVTSDGLIYALHRRGLNNNNFLIAKLFKELSVAVKHVFQLDGTYYFSPIQPFPISTLRSRHPRQRASSLIVPFCQQTDRRMRRICHQTGQHLLFWNDPITPRRSQSSLFGF